MPTISIRRQDLASLLRGIVSDPLTPATIEPWLPLVKGELKEYHDQTDELRIELQDSNRPDLWCCEGIARQIRIKLTGRPSFYPFFHATGRPRRQLIVRPGLERVRPYVAACCAVGYEVTEPGLAQFIQTQEKLAEIFGRRRSTVSIGLYRLPAIVFPVSYVPADPDRARFVPLGFEKELSLREILATHPKGIEYGPILAGQAQVPLLVDTDEQVLSFPPIINSRAIGEVRTGDRDLFVEVTGTDHAMVLLALNILAVNLADRGADVEAVEVVYPYETAYGTSVRTPLDCGKARSISVSVIQSALGESLSAVQMAEALTSYGYACPSAAEDLSVTPPPYRNDLMHPVDVAEDVAISVGYGRFSPIMPSTFTVGGVSRLERMSDRLRELLVGFGFQEVMSNILASRQDLVSRMRLTGTDHEAVVEIDNVMSQSFSCLRRSLLPSLLRVESASSRAFYPHRLFEVGEVAVPDPSRDLGSDTRSAAGALIAHAAANFSEAHSYLDLLMYYLDQPYRLEPYDHPSFFDGRGGRILVDDQELGLIGELHPEVLENWHIAVPCAAFELNVDDLAGRESGGTERPE